MNHIRAPERLRYRARTCATLGAAWSESADPSTTLRTPSTCVASQTGQGRYNIPNIGIFLWRLNDFSLTESPAVRVDDRRYLFSPLGNNAPLFTRPSPSRRSVTSPGPSTFPRRSAGASWMPTSATTTVRERSILINRDGIDLASQDVVACDLSDAGGGTWAHRPQDKIAIDPVLGRIAFPENQDPTRTVLVTFPLRLRAGMGGGEYERTASLTLDLEPVQPVSGGAAIQPALDAVQAGGVVEIRDSGRYSETLSIAVAAGATIELRAQDENRPTLLLGGELLIEGGDDSEVILNGLLIAGAPLRVPASAGNQLRKLSLRHCTLVPGLSLTIDGAPELAGEPSLIVDQPGVEVEIDHCIVGGVHIVPRRERLHHEQHRRRHQPDRHRLRRSARTAPGGRPGRRTAARDRHHDHRRGADRFVGVRLQRHLSRANVLSERRQAGCVRFSFLDLAAAVPRRFRCQPDLEIAERIADRERNGPPLTAAQRDAIAAAVVPWLVPRLTSTRYGDPGYGQLHVNCPRQIREGADDEAEMGAFHDLFAPQRETNLRVRLDEYLRFGLEAGIFYAT